MTVHLSSKASHRHFIVRGLSSILLSMAVVAFAGRGDAHAESAVGICGDATVDGAIDSSDALFTLRVAVGVGDCSLYRCDPNASGTITAIDALIILTVAVGTDVPLSCPEFSSTTSTSVPIPQDCGNNLPDPGEACDPPGKFCRGGCDFLNNICADIECQSDCSCPPAYCGDSVIDPDEDCDPVGSLCEDGICGAGCICQPSF